MSPMLGEAYLPASVRRDALADASCEFLPLEASTRFTGSKNPATMKTQIRAKPPTERLKAVTGFLVINHGICLNVIVRIACALSRKHI